MGHGKQGRKPAAQNPGPPGILKRTAGRLSVLAGSALGFYIGIWRMLVPSLLGLFEACKDGQLTVSFVIFTFFKCWLALTISGLVWTIGYMIKCMLDAG